MLICLRLLAHRAWLPFSLAVAKAGRSMPAKIAMIAITTRSSISVNPPHAPPFLSRFMFFQVSEVVPFCPPGSRCQRMPE